MPSNSQVTVNIYTGMYLKQAGLANLLFDRTFIYKLPRPENLFNFFFLGGGMPNGRIECKAVSDPKGYMLWILKNLTPVSEQTETILLK